MFECSVIATDLDGTLLNTGRTLSERNRKALQSARERGIKVVAVTARSARGVAAVPGLAESLDAVICNNGAVYFEPGNGTVDVRRTIDLATVTELHTLLTDALPNGSFAVESGSGVYAQRAHIPAGPSYDDPWYECEDLASALAAAGRVVEYRFLDRVTGPEGMVEAVGHLDVPGVVRWIWPGYPVIEYNAEGVDKGGALAAWCSERGFGPESVVAFGDAPNDVPMLAWAGRSYAVAGAKPAALAAAGLRTASNDDDGVAEVVESLLAAFGPAGDA